MSTTTESASKNQFKTAGWDITRLLSAPVTDVQEASQRSQAFLSHFLPPSEKLKYEPTIVHAVTGKQGIYAPLDWPDRNSVSGDFRKAFGKKKICYHVNICDPELRGKASKFHVRYLHAVLIDIEPKGALIDQLFLDAVREKIEALKKERGIEPAIVIFTGNGMHVIYFMPLIVKLPEISEFHYALASGNDSHVGKGLKKADREAAKVEMHARCVAATEAERAAAKKDYAAWLAEVEPIEARWRWLNAYFDGDAVANIDRVAGLPGTINPKADEKTGRKPRTVRIIEYRGVIISEDAWEAIPQIASGSRGHAGSSRQATAAAIAQDDPHTQFIVERVAEIAKVLEDRDLKNIPTAAQLPDVAQRVLTDLARYQAEKAAAKHAEAMGKLALATVEGKLVGGTEEFLPEPDKSRGLMSFVLSVFGSPAFTIREKVKTCLFYMTSAEHGGAIAEHVAAQAGKPMDVARRQLVRTMAYLAPKIVSQNFRLFELNERHAAIRDLGGKFRIAWQHDDGNVSFQATDDFGRFYANQPLVYTDEHGEPAETPIGPAWVRFPWRREFDRVDFCPDGAPSNVFNLWQGFPCEYFEGDIPDELNTLENEPECLNPYLDYVYEVLANTDKDVYHYLLDFQADMLINPARKPDTVPVLFGEEGTGKTKYGELTGKIVGARNSLLITSPEMVMNHFNRHLANKIFHHIDEAFFSGDPRHVRQLLNKITAPTMLMTPKGVDTVTIRDLSRSLISTNDPKPVHASKQARRFMIQEVSTKHQEDRPYFKRLDDWFDGGGRVLLAKWYLSPAYRDYLTKHDLKMRGRPKTKALAGVQARSLDHVHSEVLTALQTGEPKGGFALREDGGIAVHVSSWAEAISRSAHRSEAKETLRATLSNILKQIGGEQPPDNRVYIKLPDRLAASQERCVFLPPIKETRENFEREIGFKIPNWENIDAWQPDDETRLRAAGKSFPQ